MNRRKNTRTNTIRPMLLTIPQVAELLSLGRTKVYELIAKEGLPSVKLQSALRVPADELEQWVCPLPRRVSFSVSKENSFFLLSPSLSYATLLLGVGQFVSDLRFGSRRSTMFITAKMAKVESSWDPPLKLRKVGFIILEVHIRVERHVFLTFVDFFPHAQAMHGSSRALRTRWEWSANHGHGDEEYATSFPGQARHTRALCHRRSAWQGGLWGRLPRHRPTSPPPSVRPQTKR